MSLNISFHNNNGQQSKYESAFNQFIGVPGSEKVVAIFTTNKTDSAQLLRYCNQLVPRAECAVKGPNFDSKYMGSSTATPTITTVEPLVPTNVKELPIVACPQVVYSADFLHFIIPADKLQLTIFCMAMALFDGQPSSDCPCLEIDNRLGSFSRRPLPIM